MVVEGTIREFGKYFGTAYFGNLVKDRTKKMPPKRLRICDGINNTPSHKVEKPGDIRFCHTPGRSRLDILCEVLSRYMISDTIVRCNIKVVEDEFWEAHFPIDKSGKFLCATCRSGSEYR
jgi:hypothetical protein